MKKALIIIDYTNDFVADDGQLTVGKPGQAIAGGICELVDQAAQEKQPIFIVNDIHELNEKDHPESKLFPPHNIRGTKGREVFPVVQRALDDAQKVSNASINYLRKTRYTCFSNTDFEQMLAVASVKELVLCGVCTDICVLHTAISAYNKGFGVTVYKKAVASFNPQAHEWALEHMKNVLGYTIIV